MTGHASYVWCDDLVADYAGTMAGKSLELMRHHKDDGFFRPL